MHLLVIALQHLIGHFIELLCVVFGINDTFWRSGPLDFILDHCFLAAFRVTGDAFLLFPLISSLVEH